MCPTHTKNNVKVYKNNVLHSYKNNVKVYKNNVLHSYKNNVKVYKNNVPQLIKPMCPIKKKQCES